VKVTESVGTAGVTARVGVDDVRVGEALLRMASIDLFEHSSASSAATMGLLTAANRQLKHFMLVAISYTSQ
jgi:hypothetical protein